MYLKHNSVRLRVLMPCKVVADEEADLVILRTIDGDKGIMPNHEPCTVALGHGALRLRRGKERIDALTVAGGYAVIRDGEVVVMTPVADTPERIGRVVAAIAEERKKNEQHEQAADLEMSRAETALRQTLVRREGSAYATLKGQFEKGDDKDEAWKERGKRKGK
jgi:F-type H+-transporting ATPase subunit epsilon